MTMRKATTITLALAGVTLAAAAISPSSPKPAVAAESVPYNSRQECLDAARSEPVCTAREQLCVDSGGSAAECAQAKQQCLQSPAPETACEQRTTNTASSSTTHRSGYYFSDHYGGRSLYRSSSSSFPSYSRPVARSSWFGGGDNDANSSTQRSGFGTTARRVSSGSSS